MIDLPNDPDSGEALARFLARYSPPSALPVDVRLALDRAKRERPGVLSPRADAEEGEGA